MACDHSGFQSGGAKYLRSSSQLQLVLVCDACGAERVQLGRIDYRLQPRRGPARRQIAHPARARR